MLDFGFTKTNIKKYSTISNTSTIIKFVSNSNRPETHWVSTAHQLISYVQEGVSSPYVGHGWSTVLGRASDALISLHIFHHAVIPANTSALLTNITAPHTTANKQTKCAMPHTTTSGPIKTRLVVSCNKTVRSKLEHTDAQTQCFQYISHTLSDRGYRLVLSSVYNS